jgi:VWFA-related protein
MPPTSPQHRSQHAALAASLLLLLLNGTSGAAPPPPSPPLSADASSEISVTVVEIPVEVARGGKPVEGLQAADFEVLENGHPLSIVSCEAIELRDAQTAAPAPAAQSAPVPALSAAPPQAARRHLFLLFDFALSTPERQAEGIAAARRTVAGSLDPSDLVGVGVYLPKGALPILLPFTSDRAAVDRTLDALSGLLTGKAPEVAGKDDPLRVLGADARQMLAQQNRTREVNHAAQMLADFGESAEEALGGAAALARNDVESRQRDHVMALVESLAGLGDYLRPIEGRKYLAFFSGGFGDRLVQRPTEGPGDANLGGSALLAKLDETLGALKHLGWVIHAANLGTLHGGGLNGDGLFILADKTGGVLVEGGNNLAPGLGRAMSQSAHSYLLTVQVDVPPDGAYHPLEVRLRDKARGTRIIHRGGYFAPKRTGS